MNKQIKWMVFAVMALVQLAVPGYLVLRHEDTFATGKIHRFETAPVDPYDPFSGRYVTLNLKTGRSVAGTGTFRRGEQVFAVLQINPQGFSEIVSVQRNPPLGKDYFTTTVGAYGQLEIPFTRFYMEESLAPRAEEAYRKMSRVGNKSCWIEVKIKNGRSMLTNLYLDEQPVHEYLKKH